MYIYRCFFIFFHHKIIEMLLLCVLYFNFFLTLPLNYFFFCGGRLLNLFACLESRLVIFWLSIELHYSTDFYQMFGVSYSRYSSLVLVLVQFFALITVCWIPMKFVCNYWKVMLVTLFYLSMLHCSKDKLCHYLIFSSDNN